VTGRVRSADGKPVAGAAVRLDPETGPGQNRTVATDADGSFEIAGVTPGAYRVTVQHRDWALGLAGGLRPQRGADAEVEITLAAPARVTGRLVDDRERPVAGAVALAEVDGATLPVNPAMAIRTEA